MLLPVRCAVCSRAGRSPCATCVVELRRAPPLPPPPGLDACFALVSYEGAGRELVARLKYRNCRGSLTWLATGMAALLGGEPVGCVTWAPTSAGRRRGRGFDQAELMARRVARALGCPVLPLLERLDGAPQTGRSRSERLHGPQFRLRGVAAASGRRYRPAALVVVDDVVTTGATLGGAGRVLRAGGHERVVGLAAARTPGGPGGAR